MEFQFPAIGIIHSCFKEKFGIPRQPSLAPLACASIELLPPYNQPEALTGLDASSHLWVQFVFHANKREDWKPRVKPPRLGGNKSLGVFATRAPTRPAPIGLSVVKFQGVEQRGEQLFIHISGVDLLEGTPVLDIKPYVPYVDSVPGASNSFAAEPPVLVDVDIPEPIEAFCADYQARTGTPLAELIYQILQQDPRPQYQQPEPERIYGMKLLDLELRWRYLMSPKGQSIQVYTLEFV